MPFLSRWIVKSFQPLANQGHALMKQPMVIDEIGLSDVDRKYLLIIIEKFDGGPVGVSTLAHTLSEDIQTIEEYIEPYLMRIGFIKKTGKGRVVTTKAYAHLKVTRKKESSEQTRLI